MVLVVSAVMAVVLLLVMAVVLVLILVLVLVVMVMVLVTVVAVTPAQTSPQTTRLFSVPYGHTYTRGDNHVFHFDKVWFHFIVLHRGKLRG